MICFVLICLITAIQGRIHTLHVISEIQSRFAITDVTSLIENEERRAREVTFMATLPESAFISNFTMEIDYKTIVGYVEETETAYQRYGDAKRRGQSSGHLAESPRETNTFTISVYVRAKSTVTFVLTYQQILKRVHGAYKHIVNIMPNEPVDDLQIDVLISEWGNISKIAVPKFDKKTGEKNNKLLLHLPTSRAVKIERYDANGGSLAYISFKPAATAGRSTKGQLAVLYDLERTRNGGQIEVVNGYFLHFLAPEGIKPGNKHVLFVLDKSRSMGWFGKLKQLKDAMRKILRDLNKDDLFNIIMFNTGPQLWQSKSVPGNHTNIEKAIQFLESITAVGGTNIYRALLKSITMINQQQTTLVSMIIFLTDGWPTTGIRRSHALLKYIRRKNSRKSAIHCVAFGARSNYEILKKLSAENHGLARKVYEDADADLQLEGFYAEVASPIMTDLDIHYLDGAVDVNSLVGTKDRTLNMGSELVVVGKLRSTHRSRTPLRARVSGKSVDRPKIHLISETINLHRLNSLCFPPRRNRIMPRHMLRICPVTRSHRPKLVHDSPSRLPATTLGGFIQRMWAHMTIKRWISYGNYNLKSRNAAKSIALRLSKKYNFVTSLTSMVVIPPNKTDTRILKEATRAQARPILKTNRPAPISTACMVDLAILLDTDSGTLYGDLASLIDELLGVYKGNVSIVRLGADRIPIAVYTSALGGRISTLRDLRPYTSTSSNLNNPQLQFSAEKVAVLIMFVGHKPLGPFLDKAMHLDELGVELIPVTVADSARDVPEGVQEELGILNPEFRINPTITDIIDVVPVLKPCL